MSETLIEDTALFEEIVDVLENHYKIEGLGTSILPDLSARELHSLIVRLAKQLRDKKHYEYAERMKGLARRVQFFAPYW